MDIKKIEEDFSIKVSKRISLLKEGIVRYRVFTPFRFDDGDNISILLKKENGKWALTDEGHTIMHLTYNMDESDLYKGTRQKIISNALTSFFVQDREG